VREEIDRGELVSLRWQEEFETAILMIWHKDKWLSPMLRAFMEAVRTVIGDD
jgi:DNA-binding transcriptional LysR family regulator